jgi:hypothetical protein
MNIRQFLDLFGRQLCFVLQNGTDLVNLMNRQHG